MINKKESDEVSVLDVDATVLGSEPDFILIAKLAAVCLMPLYHVGAVKTATQAARIVDMAVEKVAVSAATRSLFVLKGKYRAALINYPTLAQNTHLCRDAQLI